MLSQVLTLKFTVNDSKNHEIISMTEAKIDALLWVLGVKEVV
jgi:hypothetical protein